MREVRSRKDLNALFAAERAVDKLIETNPPVGCLHERHPKLLFAPVVKIGETYSAVDGNDVIPLDAGVKVRLWGGQVVVA